MHAEVLRHAGSPMGMSPSSQCLCCLNATSTHQVTCSAGSFASRRPRLDHNPQPGTSPRARCVAAGQEGRSRREPTPGSIVKLCAKLGRGACTGQASEWAAAAWKHRLMTQNTARILDCCIPRCGAFRAELSASQCSPGSLPDRQPSPAVQEQQDVRAGADEQRPTSQDSGETTRLEGQVPLAQVSISILHAPLLLISSKQAQEALDPMPPLPSACHLHMQYHMSGLRSSRSVR